MAKLIAHRGASAEAPENTLASLEKAFSIGVDFVEVDVHLSKDGVPVVIHDPIVTRTTNAVAPRKICEMDFAEINELDAGGWFDNEFEGQKIPTLTDVIKTTRGKAGLMIELKEHKQPELFVTHVLKAFKEAKVRLSSKILIGSFSIDIYKEIRRQAKGCHPIAIIEQTSQLPAFKRVGIQNIAMWYKLLNPPMIDSLHEEGINVWAFTVDNPEVAQFLLAIKTDGIITNDPRRLIPLIL
jgi:glycerophosphoryl diester phosphodiesterase